MILTLGKDVNGSSLAIWFSEDNGNFSLTPEKLNYSFHIFCGYEAYVPKIASSTVLYPNS